MKRLPATAALYRCAAQLIDALILLKREVMAHKDDLKLFEKSAYSLT